MSAHTPGPWRVSTIGRRNDGSIAVMSERGPVAYANLLTKAPRGKAHMAEDEESDANARLIAAAPELLEMVKELREAAAAMMRVIAYEGLDHQLVEECALAGVEKGFGKRAWDLIARIEGAPCS